MVARSSLLLWLLVACGRVGRFGSSETGSAIMVSRNDVRPVGTVGDRTIFDGAAPVL